MRLEIPGREKMSGGGITESGGAMTGPLEVPNNSTDDLHIVNKAFIDDRVNEHTGVDHLSVSDINKINGITVTAAEINRLQGVSTSTTINSQIGTKLGLGGGILGGALRANSAPVGNMDVATKNYVDTSVTGVNTVSTGTILSKGTSVTPSGFLKCNGQFVSKVNYSNLYSVLGHTAETVITKSVNMTYTSYAALGAGSPWQQQYDINSFSLGSDVTSQVLPIAGRAGAGVLVTKNRIYLLGGRNFYGTNEHYYLSAPITEDGIGNWDIVNSTNFKYVEGGQIVVIKNRLYFFKNSTNTYVYGVIDTNGDIPNSLSSGASVQGNILGFQNVIVTKNRVYVLTYNGFTVATILSDGALGPFSSTNVTLETSAQAGGSLLVTKNKVYLLGGTLPGSNVSSNKIQVSNINSDGTLGNFYNSGYVLPEADYIIPCVVANNGIYFMLHTFNYNKNIYYIPLDSDGNITQNPTIAVTLNSITNSQKNQFPSLAIVGNKLYIIGGEVLGDLTSTSRVTYVNLLNTVNNIFKYTTPVKYTDFTKFYDGSVNKFDGTNISGTVVISNSSTNPDPVSLFGLPDMSLFDKTQPNTFSYIKF